VHEEMAGGLPCVLTGGEGHARLSDERLFYQQDKIRYSATLSLMDESITLTLPLPGEHMLQNALAAAVAAHALGVPLAMLPPLFANASPKGRLERVAAFDGKMVFVDFAYTGEALADGILDTVLDAIFH